MKQDDNRKASLVRSRTLGRMAWFECDPGASRKGQRRRDRMGATRRGCERGVPPWTSATRAGVLSLNLDTFGPRVQHRTATREVDTGLHHHVHGRHVTLDMGALLHLD